MSETMNDYGDLLDGAEHRWRSRLIWLAALAVLVVAGAYVLWAKVLSGGGSATAAIQTATVQRGSISNTVSTTGTVAAQSTTDLSFDQSGTISAVNVKLGQEVKAGDVLAEIESDDLQDSLTTAQVNLSSVQTNLNKLLKGSTEAELASADQSLLQAQVSYDQAVRALQDLQEPPTASERLSAEQAVTSAQAQLDQAKLALSDLTAAPTASEQLSADQAVTSAQAQLDKANRDLSDLQAGPTTSERLSAQQAVTSAQAQLDQAEASRAKLDSTSDDAIAAAEAAVTKAQSALDSAERVADRADDNLASAEASLKSAEAAFCGNYTPGPGDPDDLDFCDDREAPISSSDQDDLEEIADSGDAADAALAASMLAANNSYENAVSSAESADDAVDSAENDLEAAESDLDEAENGPSSEDIAIADAAVTAAQQAVDSANAKLSELNAGATASELATAQENVKTAQGGLDTAKAKLAELNQPTQSDLEKAQDSVVTAQAGLDTAKAKLTELNEGATQSELQKAQDAVSTAASALAATQAKVNETYAGSTPEEIALQRNQLQLAQLSVKQAQKNLEGAKLVAPFDGTVAALSIEVGEVVAGAGGDTAIVLNTPNAVRLNLTITESDLPNVKAGQSGTAVFDALEGSEFPIVIDSVGVSPTTTQGVVTYQVRASFVTGTTAATTGATSQGAAGGRRSALGGAAGGSATPLAGTPAAGATPPAGAGMPQATATATSEAKPLPGMNATVTIIVDQAQNVLVIPDSAIQTEGQNSVVEVQKDDGSTEMVVVQTGLSDGTNTEITAGLEEGQTIIIPGRTTTTTSAQATSVTGAQQGGFQFEFRGPEGGGAPSGVGGGP